MEFIIRVDPNATVAPIFADVPDNAYFAEPVQWAINKGITNGTGNNNFSPELTCTRGQIVTFPHRYFGCWLHK